MADAITNQANPSDSYPYYTALGINLPASSRPTCVPCLQDTMSIFAGYAADKSQSLASTYMPTAQQIDIGCGPTFANVSVPIATIGNATGAGTKVTLRFPAAVISFLLVLVLLFV